MMAFLLEHLVGLGEGTRILILFKNSMIVRQWRLEDIHHPQSVLPRSRRSTVDHKEGQMPQAVEMYMLAALAHFRHKVALFKSQPHSNPKPSWPIVAQYWECSFSVSCPI